ncbi:hypothetical protein VNO78_16399 [Psophocarpus tetragonolobus]|uniref:DNA 3'-5' helicase n=1 Tax=Psophocarpus tetragonolobus TaxID=3891 RepID=A0AAN9SLD9_PSOTE
MEYDRSTVLQVHLYENLLNGCEVVESQLLSCVTEHLLAEIVQLTVSDITKAIEWLKCSYLYVRMQKIPEDKGKKKRRIQTREEKIFVLASDCLTGDPSVHDLSLIQDMNSICSNGCRIAKCMKDYFVYKRNYRGAVNSALLAKSLDQKLWDDSPYLLKQLPGIGMVTAKALHSMGIKSFEALAEADPRRIELVTGRKYPFGNHIKDSLLSLPPKVDLTLAEIESHIKGKSKIVVTLARISQSGQSVRGHYADMIVGLEEDNTILFHEKIRVDQFSSFVHSVGIDVHQKLSFIRESNSIVLLKRGRKQACCPPPEEIYVIEDDIITVPHLPTKELSTLSEDKDFLPSFDLLDESLEEAEGGHVLHVVEEDKCKIITEKTVFDHIREKAKNFCLLSAFDNIRCPSLEVLLSRNHACEKRPAQRCEVVVLDDEDEPEVPQQNYVNLPLELRNAEKGGVKLHLTLNDHSSTVNSNNMSSVIDTGKPLLLTCHLAISYAFYVKLSSFHFIAEGVFLPQPASRTEKSTEETIFDHIRKKSKDFPLINKLDCVEPIIHKTEKNSPSSLIAAFGVARESKSSDMVSDDVLTSYMKTAAEVEKCTSSIQVGSGVKSKEFESCYDIDGKVSISNGVSSNFSFKSSIYALTVSFSTWKEKKRLSNDSDQVESSKKQRCPSTACKEEKSSSSEIRRQCCSLETTGQMKEIESYLGFKSVFSFL